MMKQVEVTILGQSYILGCPPGGEARLEAAVAVVDREMSSIRDNGRIKARERIAVLAALNLAYRMAERDASSSSPYAPAPTREPAQAGEGRTEAQASITALVERLDAALSDDGHLL
jgi:cell division protein ZapA